LLDSLLQEIQMGDGYTPISILHFSLDFLNINSIPGLEIGGYLDSLLNSMSSGYVGLIILSFLIVIFGHFGVSYLNKNESAPREPVKQNDQDEDNLENPPRRESMISAVKKAKQKALKDAVERNMTDDERERELKATSEMLSKVYSVMKDNEEIFGSTSFDDVKSQMELYKEF